MKALFTFLTLSVLSFSSLANQSGPTTYTFQPGSGLRAVILSVQVPKDCNHKGLVVQPTQVPNTYEVQVVSTTIGCHEAALGFEVIRTEIPAGADGTLTITVLNNLPSQIEPLTYEVQATPALGLQIADS